MEAARKAIGKVFKSEVLCRDDFKIRRHLLSRNHFEIETEFRIPAFMFF